MTCAYCGFELDQEEFAFRQRSALDLDSELGALSIIDIRERTGPCGHCGLQHYLDLNEEYSLHDQYAPEGDAEEQEFQEN